MSAATRGCAFFFSSRRRHTRWPRDWSSDVCSSDLLLFTRGVGGVARATGGVPAALRELQAAVVAVAGADRPVATGLALGQPVPDGAAGRAAARRGGRRLAVRRARARRGGGRLAVRRSRRGRPRRP